MSLFRMYSESGSKKCLPDIIGSEGIFIDGDWVESKDQDENGDVRLVQLADIGDGIFRNRSNRFMTSEKAKLLRCTYLQRGDILVARMPEPLGRACLFPGDTKPCVTVVDVCIVRPNLNDVEPRWLMHAINSPSIRSEISSLQAGTTRKRISRKNLATIEFQTPSKEEQASTADEIEKQFSRLDAGIPALKRAQANLKRYRASVLKAACEGHIVPTEAELARHEGRGFLSGEQTLAKINEDHKKSGMKKANFTPETDELPDLPLGWTWATISQLAAPVPNSTTDGPFGSNLKTEHYVPTGPVVIRLTNIGDGKFIQDLSHISTKHFLTLQKHRAFPGDLVIAAFGANPPRSCIVPQDLGEAIVKADCIRFKPSHWVSVPYLNIALNSEPVRTRTKGMVHGVGRPRLNLAEIRSIPLPLPPLAEQERIVAEVERRLSVADAVEASLNQQLIRATRLRQSILAKAFQPNKNLEG